MNWECVLRDMSVYFRKSKSVHRRKIRETLFKCVDCSCNIFLLYEHML